MIISRLGAASCRSAASICAAVSLLLAAAGSQAQTINSAGSANGADGSGKQLDLDQVVVTGVFNGIKKEDATVAISTVNSSELEKLIPQSAADLITNVPGVFVDSSHGEIRNVIYSRGVSANSLDGASGYFYVAMEEDGLPVTNVTFSNFGPDYFLRADLTLDRLEAVRGGAAAVTGPNAPGGIFNYISKQGTDENTGQVSLRTGLEGDGGNPYYRGDAWFGGPLGAGWTYSVGGFFRRSDGPQNPRYPMNNGGQVKMNLTRKFDGGFVQFYAKYLNDINGFSNFIPATNFSDPRAAPGWNTSSNPTPPRTSFDYQTGPDQFAHFDSRRQQENTSKVVGMRAAIGFGDSWTMKNDIKFSRSGSVWNSYIGILPQALTDFFTPAFYGTLGTLGTYTYRDPVSGRTASINQSGLLSASIINSNLPLNQLMPGSGMASIALDYEPRVDELMDQVSLTKDFDHMSFTLGLFASFSHADITTRDPGFGVTTIEPNPNWLGLSILDPAGQTLQVTNPQGIGPIIGSTAQQGSWNQLSVFFGHRWQLTRDWTLDWGARVEMIHVSATNSLPTNTAVVSPSGGLDGNQSTLYDNSYVPGPAQYFKFGHKLHNESYTAAILRKLTEQQSIYARYSKGSKAPDLTVFLAQTDPASSNLVNTTSQRIQQVEIGYKYAGPRASVVLTPYYSLLDNVQITQAFINPFNAQTYPRTTSNALESWGIETESDWNVGYGFDIRTAISWQRSTATKRFNWVQGATPDQDKLVDLSGGRADNNPDVMATITPSYTRGPFSAQAQWRYMGKRPANADNAFYLPSYNTTNLQASWAFTRDLSVSATVNNVLNSRGVVEFTVPATNLVADLNRQSLTKEQIQAAPNALFTILPIQSRAYYLEANYKF